MISASNEGVIVVWDAKSAQIVSLIKSGDANAYSIKPRPKTLSFASWYASFVFLLLFPFYLFLFCFSFRISLPPYTRILPQFFGFSYFISNKTTEIKLWSPCGSECTTGLEIDKFIDRNSNVSSNFSFIII